MSPHTRFFFSGFLTIAVSLLVYPTSYAHHSFAPYDIRNAIEITGIAQNFAYRRPHPMLTLLDEKGISWVIEVPVRRWERAGLASDLIEPRDQLVVRVFPARDGSPNAAMSGFMKEGTYYTITDDVRQRSGNEAADAIESGEPLEKVLNRYAEPSDAAAEANDTLESDNRGEEVPDESTQSNLLPWEAGLASALIVLLGFAFWKRS